MSLSRATMLNGLLERFPRAKILVVGDLMLDEFVWGKVSRISPEAPVPVVWVQRESAMPGGAANVANNIRALGGQVTVVGIVGDDAWGSRLRQELTGRRIDVQGLVTTKRPTTVKTRVIAHHQQVVRVDREQSEPLPAGVTEQLIKTITGLVGETDAVVIEDYGKGVITRRLLEAVIPLARTRGKLVTVDPKEEHFELYRGVTALTPNRAEAGGAIGYELRQDADIQRAGRDMLRRLECQGVLITLGEDGMWLFEPRSREARIPTVAREVFDVAGAGDTVIATFTLALASGATMEQAARIANYAAGIVVGKLGIAVATPGELRAALNSQPRAASRTRISSSGAPRASPGLHVRRPSTRFARSGRPLDSFGATSRARAPRLKPGPESRGRRRTVSARR